jgi:signal transduction histidine kinase
MLGVAVLTMVSYFFYKKISEAVNKESVRLFQQRNDTFANIAHDLKNLMASVLGFARVLEEGRVSSDEQQAVYHTIAEKSVQMNNMILKMFEYAKMESDGYSLRTAQEGLCGLLREVVADHYSEMERHAIKPAIDIPETPVWAEIDRAEFGRLLNNLIINAILHNDNGVQLLTKLETTDERIRIWIADSGKAIPQNLHESIFEPFQCSDESPDSPKKAAVLGLPFPRELPSCTAAGFCLTIPSRDTPMRLSWNWRKYK